MIGWHHQLNGHEFEQTEGDREGQGSLACCIHGEKCEAVLSAFKSVSVKSVHTVFAVIVLISIAHILFAKFSPRTPVSSKVQLNN